MSKIKILLLFAIHVMFPGLQWPKKACLAKNRPFWGPFYTTGCSFLMSFASRAVLQHVFQCVSPSVQPVQAFCGLPGLPWPKKAFLAKNWPFWGQWPKKSILGPLPEPIFERPPWAQDIVRPNRAPTFIL